jgi:hypothetical protein
LHPDRLFPPFSLSPLSLSFSGFLRKKPTRKENRKQLFDPTDKRIYHLLGAQDKRKGKDKEKREETHHASTNLFHLVETARISTLLYHPKS